MGKSKSKKVKKFRALDVESEFESTSNTAVSGKPSGTFRKQKKDTGGDKESPHIEDEGIGHAEESNLKTSNASEVASSDAVGAIPESMADEISHSSETYSGSTKEFSPLNIESDSTYSKNSSRNSKYKNKGGKYNRKHNDFNHASPHQDNEEEKSNERSCETWNVEISQDMTPDCSQFEKKAKRPLNRDALEFKPNSHCDGTNEQAVSISYCDSAKKSYIPQQLDYQETKGTENEIVHSHQQTTVGDTRYDRRDGNDNYHKHKPGFNKYDYPSQSRPFVNSGRRGPLNDYPQEESKSNRSDKNRWSQQNKPFSEKGPSRYFSNSRDADSESYGGRGKYRSETKHPRDSSSAHDKYGNPEISVSDQTWDEECHAQPPYKSCENPQYAPNLTSQFQNEDISNNQEDIGSISKMNIRDDNNSTKNKRLATSKEALTTPQIYRGLVDPRMKRETENKQQSSEDWQKKSSRKQGKPSPSLENVDLGYKEEYEGWNDKTIKERKSYPESIPKHETERMSLGGKVERPRKEDFDRSYEKKDVEYEEFNEKFRWNGKFEYVKVMEMDQDLFEMSKEYSLGHCVAEDFRMGSGIAVTFKRLFKGIHELLSQRKKQGNVAVLEDNNRYIYYLVTKKVSTGKPTYDTFWSSLKEMRNHIVKHGVQKLAIPKIGCGLDRLEWTKVKYMIEFLFRDVDVEIVVCDFQQVEDTPQKDSLSTRLVYHHEPLKDIDKYTIILYFSTEDGHISKEVEELDKKFNFLAGFRRSFKKFGLPIRHEIKDYILYGCIVREKLDKQFDFKSFAKCLNEIDKNNRKDKYEYVALQPVYDETDDLLNEKVITLLRNYLRKVDIYICSGKTSEEQ